MTRLLVPEAVATIDGDAFDIQDGATTLDLGSVPYARASLQLPFLDDAVLEWLDPRDGVRVTYTAGDAAEAARPFDMGLRSRVVDHSNKTVTLELASDESILMDYRSLTTDAGARAHESSLRDVVQYVLDKIGATLEPGADDADVTAHWTLTNLIQNPVFGIDLTGYTAGTGASSLTRLTGGAYPIAQALRWTGAAGSSYINGPMVSVREGQTYTFSVSVASGTTSRTARLMVRFNGAAGKLADRFSSTFATGVSPTYTRHSFTVTVPPGAQQLLVYVNVTDGSAGQLHFMGAVQLVESGEDVPFFMGDTPDDADYFYSWEDEANLSTSLRTPVVERAPETFTWNPGVSAWDFLMPITSSAGLVLWCDETRAWRLATPEHRVIADTVSVSTSTTRDGTDELSRDDVDVYATGVVVHYTWNDEHGNSREAYDVAGTPDIVALVEFDEAYPGPGAAGAILARRAGTGRKQDVSVISQITTTPGMTVLIGLPGAPDTIGRVAAVTFDHASGFMQLEASGLVDIVPGSIAALLGDIDSLAGTIDSL